MYDERPLVLVSSPLFERERLLESLRVGGAHVERLPERVDSSAEKHLMAKAEAAVISPECAFPESYVKASPQLKIIVSPVIGVDHIAVDALTERGVPVAHGPDPVNFAGMAEAVIGLIVALMHRFWAKERELRKGAPRSGSAGSLLRGKTVGLVGGGRIGRAILQRLQGWGCRLLLADPKLATEEAQELGAEIHSLPDLLEEADVVTLQVPLTPLTRGMLSEAEFARMKPGAYLINVSRGGVVDEEALFRALTSGTLAGAAIDVWETEPPPPEHPLLSVQDSLIATPHNAGHTNDAYVQLADLAARQTLAGLKGEAPVHLVNPQVLSASQYLAPANTSPAD